MRATNAEGDSPYSSSGSGRTNAPIPVLQPPQAPTGLTATSTGTDTVDLTWNSLRGAAHYEVQRGTSNTGPWFILDSSVTDESYQATGLAAGATYYFRVSAYGDGTTHSAAWGPESAPAQATTLHNPPANLTSASGDGTITLTWDAVPGADKYRVYQWWGVPPNPRFRLLAFSDAHSGATYTLNGSTASGPVQVAEAKIGGLTNAAEYRHRVVSVRSGVESAPGELTTALPLAAPTNLNVRPLPRRQARLTWETSSNNPSGTSYEVEIQAQGGGWTSADIETRSPMASRVLDIDLDNVMQTKALGLADSPYAYEVRVRATSGAAHMARSDEITIIDNPLLVGGGRASGANSLATLNWARIPGVSRYVIQYRQLGSYRETADLDVPGVQQEIVIHHSSEHWARGATWPYYGDRHPEKRVNQGNSRVISTIFRGLDHGEIYAFQLNYVMSDSSKVYSARDAFVWPSTAYPEENKRVATYPFFGHHPTRTFEYIICTDTFPTDPLDRGLTTHDPNATQRDRWTNIVTNAFEEWETATGGFVTVTRNGSGNCAAGPMASFIATDDSQSEARMFDLQQGRSIWSFPEVKSDVFKMCVIDATACVTSFGGYSGIGHNDATRQRILDFFEEYSEGDLTIPELFGGLISLISSLSTGDRKAENELESADITFNKARFAGTDLELPTSTPFNTCLPDRPDTDPDAGYKAYRTAVHEAGHALGLSNITLNPFLLGQPYEIAHPTIPDAVMNYDHEPYEWGRWVHSVPLNEPDCSPHPFDVLAIYALYQKATR